jgi:hypothetical protein
MYYVDVTCVSMKRTLVCDVTPWRPVGVHWPFGGTYCLHVQGQAVSQASNHEEAEGKQGG